MQTSRLSASVCEEVRIPYSNSKSIIIVLIFLLSNPGIPRFVYVSTVENNLPSFLLSGYFNGKRRAEEAVRDAYPSSGVVLRPGFIYGVRGVDLPGAGRVGIPLGIVGK